MNFKKIYKHINRGLVLAVILIISIVTYVIVDEVGFENEKEQIKTVLSDYFEETSKLSIMPVEIGSKLSKEQMDEKIKAVDDLMQKYWASKVNMYGQNAYERTEQNFKGYFKFFQNEKVNFKIESLEVKIQEDTKVSKNGPKSARVALRYGVKSEKIGDAYALFLSGVGNHLNDGMGNYLGDIQSFINNQTTDFDKEEVAVPTDVEMSSNNFVANVELEKINGKWMIVSA